MNPEQFLPRLAFIKYLYDLGVEQSYRPLPRAYAAILTFHDTVELFLVLACEHHNAAIDRRTKFEQYFEELAKIPAGGNVTGKTAMLKLNEARVSLKHRGIFPDPTYIEEARISMRAFFEDNTPNLFGSQFESVSMVDLVEDPEARKPLKEATSLIEQGNLPEAMRKVARSFFLLTLNYENSKRQGLRFSPFRFGDSLEFESSFSLRIKDEKIARYVDKSREAIRALQGAVRILSLGLDYRRYVRFQVLTPKVWRSINQQLNVDAAPPGITSDDVQFCFDFVIEAALRLQEFDFELRDRFPLYAPPQVVDVEEPDEQD